MSEEREEPKEQEQEQDIEQFLEQRRKLDAQFDDKFTKVLTVMFTDLKGSTTLTESAGDLETRLMLKHHHELVAASVKSNSGTLVKTIGDGTLSHFPTAQDALHAGVAIQKGMDEYNMVKKSKVDILVRIGLHTGKVIFEKNDIFGDVVNTASRVESSANAGEVQLSEDTYHALANKDEYPIRFAKEVTLKGKKDPTKLYKAFWNQKDLDADIAAEQAAARQAEKKGMSVAQKFALGIIIPVVIILVMTLIKNYMDKQAANEESRSITHSADKP